VASESALKHEEGGALLLVLATGPVPTQQPLQQHHCSYSSAEGLVRLPGSPVALERIGCSLLLG